MKNIRILTSSMLCAAGLAALGANANAATIPVADPLFDQFPAGQTAATYLNFGCGPAGANRNTCAFADNTVVGWTQSALFNETTDQFSGQWQIGLPQVTNSFSSAPMINATTSEPIVLREADATTSQIVSTTAVPGVTYTLNVDLGFETFADNNGSVDLMVGGHTVVATKLASNPLTLAEMQGSGNWFDFEASFTATSADAGAPIEIVLSSLTHFGFAFFGDVRLTDSLPTSTAPAAPEPATWAMMLIGFGGMAGVAAYRRSLQRRSAVDRLA
jgi:hypothetical protein